VKQYVLNFIPYQGIADPENMNLALGTKILWQLMTSETS
jgi:hypothetical protein